MCSTTPLAADFSHLQMVWHGRLRGGYGWIFPGPGGLFNIGAGLTGSHLQQVSGEHKGKGRMQDVNLRQMFNDFCDLNPTARELVRDGRMMGGLKARRCAVHCRAPRSRGPACWPPAKLSAAPMPSAAKASARRWETGLLAADTLLRKADDDAGVRADYASGLQALKPRFDLYESASRVNFHPWIADVVVWRARRSARIRARLSAVLEETQNPGQLFSLRGVRKLLTE